MKALNVWRRALGNSFEGTSRRACPELAEGFHDTFSDLLPVQAMDAGWILAPKPSGGLASLVSERSLGVAQ
jgi:hypothetical protein